MDATHHSHHALPSDSRRQEQRHALGTRYTCWPNSQTRLAPRATSTHLRFVVVGVQLDRLGHLVKALLEVPELE
jgi:hypothetical protein